MEACPYLTPIVADRLWLYTVPAYCRRPDSRIRVPAPTTMALLCTVPEHRWCPGYCASRAWPGRGSRRSGAGT